MIDFNNSKNSIKKYIIFFFLVLAICVVFFIRIKYHVEGEKNIPFKITKFMVVSSAQTQELELNDKLYQANIIQNNDIYIAIEKNENYKKQDAIRKIIFNNFSITNQENIGSMKIYRTSLEDMKYSYIEKYEIADSLEFVGDLNTNLKMENMTVSNQGGLLEFSIVLDDLGKITYTENENIASDGTLIKRLNLDINDIKKMVSFDMIIELTSGKTFKSTITLELPTGDITQNGVCTNENVDSNSFIFKRV